MIRQFLVEIGSVSGEPIAEALTWKPRVAEQFLLDHDHEGAVVGVEVWEDGLIQQAASQEEAYKLLRTYIAAE